MKKPKIIKNPDPDGIITRLRLRVKGLKQALKRAKVELKVRTHPHGYPSIPEQYRGQRAAFDSGFNAAWAAHPSNQRVYGSLAHQRAYLAGYNEGARQSESEIKRGTDA
jgi:hypothetical protein